MMFTVGFLMFQRDQKEALGRKELKTKKLYVVRLNWKSMLDYFGKIPAKIFKKLFWKLCEAYISNNQCNRPPMLTC